MNNKTDSNQHALATVTSTAQLPNLPTTLLRTTISYGFPPAPDYADNC